MCFNHHLLVPNSHRHVESTRLPHEDLERHERDTEAAPLRESMTYSPLTSDLDAQGLGLGDLSLDVLALLQGLLPLDDLSNTLDEEVAQIDLGVSETVGVGDVPGTTGGGGVNTGGSTGLEAHLLQDVLEVSAGRELGDLDHGTSAEARSQVGGAGQDVPEVIVVHEVVALTLEALLDSLGGIAEALEDGSDVVALLHGDDAHLIFLVDPDEEVLSVVVEDSTSIGPVAAATGREEQSRVGLLEEVSVRTKRLLLLGRHGTLHGLGPVEREVLTLELTFELVQALHNNTLGLATLLEAAGRGKGQSPDGATSAAASGQDVFAIGVDLGLGQLVHVHAGGMLGIGFVATVALLNDNVKEILEGLVALLVTGDDSASHDVRVSGVVNASLDALGESDTTRGLDIFVLGVDLGVVTEGHGAEVAVVGKVGERLGALVTREGGALLLADVLVVAASLLDPVRQLGQSGGETFRRVGHLRLWCFVRTLTLELLGVAVFGSCLKQLRFRWW